MDTTELSTQEKFQLIQLMMDLRQTPPMGIVGLIETRNLLGRLFPDYESIRDADLDADLIAYATSQKDEVPTDEEALNFLEQEVSHYEDPNS